MSSNTGSIALRLDDVQPPNTAATQSLLISFSAFSANTVGSEAPSSATIWIFLPSTPPELLISSTASAIESRTVTSLMAIVPDSEFSDPTLIVSPPEVSTQDAAVDSPAVSDALLPQPVSTSPMAASAVGAARARLEKVRMYGPFRRRTWGPPQPGTCIRPTYTEVYSWGGEH